MRGRIVRTLIGAALFLAGYAMQEEGISPFEGVSDPRFLGLLLEAMGLLLLLSPLFGRRLPETKYPRIRKEYLKPPCCGEDDEDLPEPDEDTPGPDTKDTKDTGQR